MAANGWGPCEPVGRHSANNVRTNRARDDVRVSRAEPVRDQDLFTAEINRHAGSIELLRAAQDAGLSNLEREIRELKPSLEAADPFATKREIGKGQAAASADPYGIPIVPLKLGFDSRRLGEPEKIHRGLLVGREYWPQRRWINRGRDTPVVVARGVTGFISGVELS